MRLILVRHGQTWSNLTHALDTGLPGAGLTDLGHQQAEAAASHLASQGIRAIYSSNLLRAQQTGAPLAALLGQQVNVRDGLREAEAGELEMRSDAESVRTYLKTYLAWINGDLDVRMPGGESGADVVERFDAVVSEASASGADVAAIVSHGAIIRAWCAARVDNLNSEYIARNPLHNCGAVSLVADENQPWVVDAWQGASVGGFDALVPGDPSAETPAHLG